MTPEKFVSTWYDLKNRLNEIAGYQSHFNHVCDLVGHPHPYDGNLETEDFRFEKTTAKSGGGIGRADVFYRGKFIWEYKAAHKSLDDAYSQIQRYRESLGNPPLLIVSNFNTIRIHTNFVNTVSKRYEFKIDELIHDPKNPDRAAELFTLLKTCFASIEEIETLYKPKLTMEAITKATAAVFVDVVDNLRAFDKNQTSPEQFAHFLGRLLFCLFAEDMNLIPDRAFRRTVSADLTLEQFTIALRQLFERMRDGGMYGYHPIPYFNGNLFDDDFIPLRLPTDLNKLLFQATLQDWRGVEPSIFGTLFERVIDEEMRAKIGVDYIGMHYTGLDDILLVVDPVLMAPLRREWDEVRRKAERAIRQEDEKEAHRIITQFSNKIAETSVLDPACGSGNFLYVALRQLLNLQKRVIVYAEQRGLPAVPLTVHPSQLHGIEINPFAHELAQITIWIGYIQWRVANGYGTFEEPILPALKQIEWKDALLSFENGEPLEAGWPSAQVILGNPPFLGTRNRQGKIPQSYLQSISKIYSERIPGDSDFVCYWFEKAREEIEKGITVRAGFLATNSIRGGLNRRVLDRIKESGDIFIAWSDRDWVLEGAVVRISIVGFDNGTIEQRKLDGEIVPNINADLTTSIDLTKARILTENAEISFQGTAKAGPFDISASVANQMINANDNNKAVLQRLINARELMSRPRNVWVIDFQEISEQDASQFIEPFAYVKEHVKPARADNSEKKRQTRWWIHGRSRPYMRQAIEPLTRYIATPNISKHRVFQFLPADFVPDGTLYVFARDDDYFMGVLHSKLHELWSRRLGTQRRDASSGFRYTSTTTFETFPFPWRPGEEPHLDDDPHLADIAEMARALVQFRQAWLHPDTGDDNQQISPTQLKKRTLTTMYNALNQYRTARQDGVLSATDFIKRWPKTAKCDLTIPQIETLHDIHTDLDHAVLRAYGWPTTLTDDQILERLLALNTQRATP